MENPNIELVKNLYAAFGRGDAQYILDNMDESVVWVFEGPGIIPYTGTRFGKAEAAGFFAGIANNEQNMQLEMTQFLGDGDGVASFGRYSATAKATGKTFSTPVAHFFEVKNGKVTRYMNFVNSAAIAEAHS